MPEAPISVTISLTVAIEHGEELLEELTLTEPTLGAMMEMDKATGDMGQTLAAIVACTQLPPSVIKQLRMRDLKAVGEAAQTIMGEDQGTGRRRPRGSPTGSTSNLARLRN